MSALTAKEVHITEDVCKLRCVTKYFTSGTTIQRTCIKNTSCKHKVPTKPAEPAFVVYIQVLGYCEYSAGIIRSILPDPIHRVLLIVPILPCSPMHLHSPCTSIAHVFCHICLVVQSCVESGGRIFTLMQVT
jgi:hypothetical protein